MIKNTAHTETNYGSLHHSLFNMVKSNTIYQAATALKALRGGARHSEEKGKSALISACSVKYSLARI